MRTLPGRIWRFLAPDIPAPSADDPANLQGVRAIFLLRILRVGALLGTLAVLIAAMPLTRNGDATVLIAPILIITLAWVMALSREAEQLKARNAELNSFSHTVAHELPPLTILNGNSQILFGCAITALGLAPISRPTSSPPLPGCTPSAPTATGSG